MANLLTETLLNFELREKIGNGGEGDVHKAFDTQLNSIIAVKKVPIANFADPNDFFNESRKLYLTKHHNVVKVNYACKDDDFIYLSMPFYQNGSLKSITDKRFLTAREIIRYSLQFLSGLNNIHSKKLIHFDVKTENILISDSNQALISDFGLAQHTGHYGFATNFGTTAVYAPPELFSQALHNIKFDIYQAGLAMYRMCNGDTDLTNQISTALQSKGVKDDAHFIKNLQKGNFPNRTAYLPHIPKQLKKVINNALNSDPNDRYSSIIDMLNDLSKINNANDWEYKTNNTDKSEWTKDGYTLTCLYSNNIWQLSAMKNGRTNHTFSKKINTEVEKNKLLYDCLNENW